MIKNMPDNAGGLGLIPGLGRCSGDGNGNPLEVFLPGEFHGQRCWRVTVYGIEKSWT